jgi:16S rRNA processing protein RimM
VPQPPSGLVVMGRVLGPFGVRGWVKIEPFSEEPETLTRFTAWWLNLRQNWREMAVAESKVQGAHLIARIEGCTDRESASSFSGAEIAVVRAALPPTATNEYYQADLIGLAVINRAGECLGRIAEIFNNGAHEVLRVRNGGAERLLPFAGQVVERIDLAAGEIRVDWGADW